MTQPRSFANAVKWAYTANWGDRAFSALFMFLLAAMLGPRAFGILSIAVIYIAFIQMCLEQGLAAALIQKKDLNRAHLNSAFWAIVFLSLVLVGASVSLSEWWGRVNHVPELPGVILALSLCIPIEGLAIVQKALLKRDMQFRSLSIRANVSVLAGGIAGLGLALAGFGIWALVGQQIIKDLVGLLLLWKLSSWRPAFEFSWAKLKQLFGFSISNFTAQLGIFADGQADAVLLGLLFGPVAVGLYRLADRLMNAVLSAATTSIQAVSLPEFSRLQDDPGPLRRSVLTCIRLSAVVTLPAMAGLAAVSDSLMSTIGPNWTLSADVLKVLCVVGMLTVFTYFTGPMLQALAKPHQLALLEWSRTIIGIVVLISAALLVRHGSIQVQMFGIASARLVLAACFVAPVFLYVLLRLTDLRLRQVVRTAMPAAVAAMVAIIAVVAVHSLLRFSQIKPAVLLATETIAGMSAGLAALLSADKDLRSMVTNLLKMPGRAEPVPSSVVD